VVTAPGQDPPAAAEQVVEQVADVARHVAPGGWRRMAVGLAIGMAFGASIARLIPGDRDPDRDPPGGT
jgi:hypothetical protein